MPDRRYQYPIQDTFTQYQLAVFEKQPQRTPERACEMNPKPDHSKQSYRGEGQLKGRRASINGGDSGIDDTAALVSTPEGADAAQYYLQGDEADAREVVKPMEDAGRKVVALLGDVSDAGFYIKLIDEALTRPGGLDILVNVASKQVYVEKIADLSTKQFEATFRTKVFAIPWLYKAALPRLPSGAIVINTTSIQSYQLSPRVCLHLKKCVYILFFA